MAFVFESASGDDPLSLSDDDQTKSRACEAILHHYPEFTEEALEFNPLVEVRCGGYSPFARRQNVACAAEVTAFVVDTAGIRQTVDSRGECSEEVDHETGLSSIWMRC